MTQTHTQCWMSKGHRLQQSGMGPPKPETVRDSRKWPPSSPPDSETSHPVSSSHRTSLMIQTLNHHGQLHSQVQVTSNKLLSKRPSKLPSNLPSKLLSRSLSLGQPGQRGQHREAANPRAADHQFIRDDVSPHLPAGYLQEAGGPRQGQGPCRGRRRGTERGLRDPGQD